MSLVVDVYQSPSLAGTSYPADLEPAFMYGGEEPI
jgi:hypothetical protein